MTSAREWLDKAIKFFEDRPDGWQAYPGQDVHGYLLQTRDALGRSGEGDTLERVIDELYADTGQEPHPSWIVRLARLKQWIKDRAAHDGVESALADPASDDDTTVGQVSALQRMLGDLRAAAGLEPRAESYEGLTERLKHQIVLWRMADGDQQRLLDRCKDLERNHGRVMQNLAHALGMSTTKLHPHEDIFRQAKGVSETLVVESRRADNWRAECRKWRAWAETWASADPQSGDPTLVQADDDALRTRIAERVEQSINLGRWEPLLRECLLDVLRVFYDEEDAAHALGAIGTDEFEQVLDGLRKREADTQRARESVWQRRADLSPSTVKKQSSSYVWACRLAGVDPAEDRPVAEVRRLVEEHIAGGAQSLADAQAECAVARRGLDGDYAWLCRLVGVSPGELHHVEYLRQTVEDRVGRIAEMSACVADLTAEVSRLRDSIPGSAREFAEMLPELQRALGLGDAEAVPVRRIIDAARRATVESDLFRGQLEKLRGELTHEREQVADYYQAMLIAGFDDSQDRQAWARLHAEEVDRLRRGHDLRAASPAELRRTIDGPQRPVRHLASAGAPLAFCGSVNDLHSVDSPGQTDCPDCIARWDAGHGIARTDMPSSADSHVADLVVAARPTVLLVGADARRAAQMIATRIDPSMSLPIRTAGGYTPRVCLLDAVATNYVPHPNRGAPVVAFCSADRPRPVVEAYDLVLCQQGDGSGPWEVERDRGLLTCTQIDWLLRGLARSQETTSEDASDDDFAAQMERETPEDTAPARVAGACAHVVAQTACRYPLRHGSAPIELCTRCCAWRIDHHGPGPWRTDSVVDAIAYAKACSLDDDVEGTPADRHLRVEQVGAGLRVRGLGLDLPVRAPSLHATIEFCGQHLGGGVSTTPLEAAESVCQRLRSELARGCAAMLADVPDATVSEVLPFVRASHALCETNHTAKRENKGKPYPDIADPPRDPAGPTSDSTDSQYTETRRVSTPDAPLRPGTDAGTV